MKINTLITFFLLSFTCMGCKEKPVTTATMNQSKHPVVYFEIPVSDLERSMKFYKEVFDFDFEQDTIDGNEMAFLPEVSGSTGISGALVKGEIYKPTNNGVLIYFATDSIERILNAAIYNGGKTLFPKTLNKGWGYVAELEDSEGNRIGLKQPL